MLQQVEEFLNDAMIDTFNITRTNVVITRFPPFELPEISKISPYYNQILSINLLIHEKFV